MNRVLKAFVAGIALAAPLRAQIASSQNYGISIISIDGGGQRAASADYTQDLVVTSVSGRSVATFSLTTVLGFGGQLNTPPEAADDIRSHPKDGSVDIPIASLFINDFDPDGDPLSISSVAGTSASGGIVSIAGQSIRYVPPFGLNGLDTFQYVVGDGNGDTATATVTMVIGSAPGNQPLNTLSVTKQANGQLYIRFRQQVGFGQYIIEFTHDLNSPVWQQLENQQAGADGTVEVLVDPSDASQTFFRALVQ